jgi:hypothetical protein
MRLEAGRSFTRLRLSNRERGAEETAMNTLFGRITKTVALLVLFSASAYAVPSILYTETWNTAGTQGWTGSGDIASVNNAGGVGGALSITFNAQEDNPIAFEGIVHTTVAAPANNFNGDYSQPGDAISISSVEFSFTSIGAAPAALALYFVSGSGHEWAYNLTPGNTPYTVGMTQMGSWQGQNGVFDNATFLSDISALGGISWIGLYLRQSGAGPSEYRLDDFHLNGVPVPEPETVWLLLAVLVSLAITFRGRLLDVMSQMKMRLCKA